MIRPFRFACALVLFCVSHVHATVFINEVFINPPSSSDSTREFIELMGTPGMKLDGYGIAMVNGAIRTIHPVSQIPPLCDGATPACVPIQGVLNPCSPEIDEFFSLDGLALGANGMLVLAVGVAANYPNILADTATRYDWDGTTSPNVPMWNGNPMDPPGGLQNDGSNTIVLVRNRPGLTQAIEVAGCGDPDPCPPSLWIKDVSLDTEITFFAPPDDACYEYGNGNIDQGDPDGNSGTTLDLKGATTTDISDDLEIVDEISVEGDQGFEYDEDDRHVDVGVATGGLKERNVHALGDPQDYNPDCLSRVDYRTKGPGWPPFTGGTGEGPNGNNWQDTATEQWIRGDSKTSTGSGTSPPFYFSNAAVSDPGHPDVIQPYLTNVPRWLNDGTGVEFNFTTVNSYEIMAGRINPLAIPFIPGDVDRDGDCDSEDIAKIAAVYGNDNWIFSNSFEAAPESDSGDPATQTRPWDVDGTGNNGIEASDMQWVLNFQGNTNGRIVGVRYDSPTPTPSGSGVHLNSNAGTTCTVTASAVNGCGRALNALAIGDSIELTVRGQVTSGANVAADQQNGIMQYVHDLSISSAGILEIDDISAAGSFSTTNDSLTALQGTNGDLGARQVNGHSTSFTPGISGQPSDLYRVTLRAVGMGSANLTIGAASMAKFAASTPHGLKIGHTNNAGNPASAIFPSGIAFSVVSGPVQGDMDSSGSVTTGDIADFVSALLGLIPDPQNRSDVNCDGLKNGRDVQAMIGLLL